MPTMVSGALPRSGARRHTPHSYDRSWLTKIESLPRDWTPSASIAAELAKRSIEWKRKPVPSLPATFGSRRTLLGMLNSIHSQEDGIFITLVL
jgi:hypothetical protein